MEGVSYVGLRGKAFGASCWIGISIVGEDLSRNDLEVSSSSPPARSIKIGWNEWLDLVDESFVLRQLANLVAGTSW
jgi:hypothetical protein